MAEANKEIKSPKRGPNILCRRVNISPQKVQEFVKILPKKIIPVSKYREIMGNVEGWFTATHQAPEQWGLFYFDDEYYYPRFSKVPTLEEAEKYVYRWMRNFPVVNPYAKFSSENSTSLVRCIVEHIEAHPETNDLKEILIDIIGEPFICNDMIANAINNYSKVLSVEVIDKENEKFKVTLTRNYKKIFERDYMNKKEYFELFNEPTPKNVSQFPLQQIFYGAPGTGKSQAVNKLTEEKREVIRTTFHPDSDYSTFVGAYKPTMKGDKIEYRFVKQAFLKAYIKAWLQYSKGNKVVVEKVNKTFENKSGKYTVTSVDGKGVTYNRDFVLSRSQVKNVWPKLWTNGAYAIPSGAQPGASTRYAICDWIYQNVENCTESSFDDGWKKFVKELAQNSISHQAKTQIYIFSKAEDNDKVYVRTENNGAHKDTVQRIYDNTDAQDPSNVQDAIANLLKGYNAESFDEAWDKLREDVNNGTQVPETDEGEKVPEPVFLVIEEINRGNCAQIFGDLFQLLDRKDGFSEYPIEPDEDISAALKECNPRDGLSFGSGLVLSEALKREIDATLKEGVADRICKGEVLVLPPNLHIWATMNTSDQSLFPMDSAFKRRWDWEYIKIMEGLKKDGSPLDWKIKLDDSHELIDWWQFLQKINTVISNLTTAEDKQLGYFFCKPDEKAAPDEQENTVFSAKRFVDKVIFYLWNDVFKDYAFDDACCKDENEKEVLFSTFYNEDGKSVNSETLTQFFKKLEDDKVTFVIEKAKGLSDNKDGNKAGDENDAPQGNN